MRVILNWLPPALLSFPSPAMSLFKSVLSANGHQVSVIYWNFILEEHSRSFWKRNRNDNEQHVLYYLAPIYNYINFNRSDSVNIDFFVGLLKEEEGFRKLSDEKIREHLYLNYLAVQDKIVSTIKEFNTQEQALWGFSGKLFQLFGASVISDIIKETFVEASIVLGGNDTKDEAIASLDNFSSIDYAIWGEGEYALLDLLNAIELKQSPDNVGGLVFREDGELRVSTKRQRYLDINSGIISDYKDYFIQHTQDTTNIRIPIEGSRGCHWMKCSFCFHNEGYRYRRKTPENISKEIISLIETYGHYQFAFLDNDTIGRNHNDFERLLDFLIEIKAKYPEFKITRAEIITRFVSVHMIKKMYLAGFREVQIGYESLSEKLLADINKRNTFASNFFFTKWADILGIKIRGANLIMNLPEEDHESLIQTLENMKYLRFHLKYGEFMHQYTTLWVKKSSKYYKNQESLSLSNGWRISKFLNMVPENFIKDEYKHSLLFYEKSGYDNLWNDIEEKEYSYFKNHYSYTIYQKDGHVAYEEYVNNKLCFTYTLKDIEWHILEICHTGVLSLDDIVSKIELPQKNIVDAIDSLSEIKILYKNSSYSEIVSIINTDLIVRL